MSWHYSRVLVEGYLAATSLDGGRYVPSKTNPTPSLYSSNAKMMAFCHRSQSGMTCEPLMENRGGGVLTWYREGFPARTYPTADDAKELTEASRDSGRKWPASFAKYNRTTLSWRTPQRSLLEDSDEFSVIWPRWGMMLGGACFPLPMLEHNTSVTECGSLPTPCCYGNGGSGNTRKWDLLGVKRTKLNPSHQEWLMMWPIGWGDLTPLAMDRFHRWCDLHGKRSADD